MFRMKLKEGIAVKPGGLPLLNVHMPLPWRQAYLVRHPEDAVAAEGSPVFRDGTTALQRAKPGMVGILHFVQDDVGERIGGKARRAAGVS